MIDEKILEDFKIQIDLAEKGLQYLHDKSQKYIDEHFPPLDPPPVEEEYRLTELIHRQDLITGGMSFLLDLGFRNGIATNGDGPKLES